MKTLSCALLLLLLLPGVGGRDVLGQVRAVLTVHELEDSVGVLAKEYRYKANDVVRIILQGVPEADTGQYEVSDVPPHLMMRNPGARDGLLDVEWSLTEILAERRDSRTFTLLRNSKVEARISFVLEGTTLGSSQSPASMSDTDVYRAAQRYVREHYNFAAHHSRKKNMFIDGNVVHIFIDENGSIVEAGVPTTSQEDYVYQLHVLVARDQLYTFNFSYEGTFEPRLSVYQTPGEGVTYASGTREIEVTISEITYPPIGPFTDSFKLSLTRTDTETGSTTTLLDRTVKVSRSYHVSIEFGLYATWLRNPQNITVAVQEDGDTTLVADDPDTRGVASLMAVFYPKPRTFLFEPEGFFSWDRLAVIAGTRIDKDQFENFFLGLQMEFARGGSVAGGVHYGRRTVIAGQEDFKFGEDTFSGDLEGRLKQQWNAALFLGVNVDLRIITYFFAGNR